MIIDDKLMKYVVFKKRTEAEIRRKCNQLSYTEEYTESIIEYLTENEYINDIKYVEKYINNVLKLKKSSVLEIKMDLMRRGIDEKYIESYIDNNIEELEEFEEQSAIQLLNKKAQSMELEKVKRYLKGKGYTYKSISNAIDNYKNLEDNN